jgi:tetratricopeptide (TPR) repeat protein
MSVAPSRTIVVMAILLSFCVIGLSLAAGEADSLEKDLVRARRSYDVELAEAVLERSQDRPVLRVRAGLLLAELLRIEFETLERQQRETRTAIGRRIDAAADTALQQIEELPENSERWRMQADLIATRIRSNFRARKFHAEFEAASERALELDDANPRAWVTSAGPFVFAGPNHGQDFEEAIRLLDHALELAPGLESALLLRGLAEERRGENKRALANWRAVLEANPLCKPAETGIARLEALSESNP